MSSTLLRITRARLFTNTCANRTSFANVYATGGVMGRYRYFHGTQMVCRYSGGEKEKKNYTATESPAEGVTNTDDSTPPPRTDEHQQTNQKEPAAAGTETGNTFEELKQFAQNTAERTRAALKGENRTQSQSKTLETEHKEKRFMSTLSNMKDKVTEVKEGTKQALKDVKNAAMKAATAGKAEVEKDVNEAEAKAYAYGAKSEAEEAIESTKNTAKDTYNTAKETLEKGAENLKSKAKGYANSVKEKASQTAESMKDSTEMSSSRPAATMEPRTDRPTSGANVEPRTDRPTRGTNVGSRSDM